MLDHNSIMYYQKNLKVVNNHDFTASVYNGQLISKGLFSILNSSKNERNIVS
jgi:hypothetical protein